MKYQIRCDNTSIINLTKNSIEHLRIKLIEIRYRFIKDHVQNDDVLLDFISINR